MHTQIDAPRDGDGCCPGGATAVNDSDCMPRCGNGALEPGEDCDGGPTCSDRCTLPRLRECRAALAPLTTMEPGQVSEVIESPTGFHIVMRTAADRRPAMAASLIIVPHAEYCELMVPECQGGPTCRACAAAPAAISPAATACPAALGAGASAAPGMSAAGSDVYSSHSAADLSAAGRSLRKAPSLTANRPTPAGAR